MQLPYLWDYDIDETRFHALLNGELTIGRPHCNTSNTTHNHPARIESDVWILLLRPVSC